MWVTLELITLFLGHLYSPLHRFYTLDVQCNSCVINCQVFQRGVGNARTYNTSVRSYYTLLHTITQYIALMFVNRYRLDQALRPQEVQPAQNRFVLEGVYLYPEEQAQLSKKSFVLAMQRL